MSCAQDLPGFRCENVVVGSRGCGPFSFGARRCGLRSRGCLAQSHRSRCSREAALANRPYAVQPAADELPGSKRAEARSRLRATKSDSSTREEWVSQALRMWLSGARERVMISDMMLHGEGGPLDERLESAEWAAQPISLDGMHRDRRSLFGSNLIHCVPGSVSGPRGGERTPMDCTMPRLSAAPQEVRARASSARLQGVSLQRIKFA